MSVQALLGNRVLVLGVAFVVSCGAAIGVAAALDGDESDRTSRAESARAPQVAPVATGDTPPESAAGADGGDEPLSPVVGVSAGAGGSRGVGSDTDGPDERAESGGDDTGAGSGDDLVTIVTDECAGPEPGDETADDCPEGTGATVLPLTEPSPQWVRFFSGWPPGGWSSRCATEPIGDTEMPATVVALNPGTMRLEYQPHDDPSAAVTIDRSTASESDVEHRQWLGWFEDGTLNLENHKRVQYCLVLGDLRPGQLYTYRVTSTDIFGESAAEEGTFWSGGGRPPVTITPLGDTRVQVRVPVRSGRNEGAIVRSRPPGTCSELESGDRLSPTTSGGSFDGEEPRHAEGGPWNPAYDRIWVDRLDLDEGTTTSICIWWVSGPRRSFDTSRVNEREEHLVTTPNRYRPRVTVERIEFTEPVSAGDVTLDVEVCTPTQYPSEDITPRGIGSTSITPREVVCDLTARGDRLPRRLVVQISGTPDGARSSVSLDVSRRPCVDARTGRYNPGGGACEPVHTDWYWLGIPAEGAESGIVCRLCRSAGRMLLRVDLVDGPAEGGDEFSFGAPSAFAGEDVDPPDTPPYPRVDERSSGVVPIPGRHDALRVVANLDRPATVRVVPAGLREPCLQPGATGGAASAVPLVNHDLVIAGLCAGHPYDFALEMTDDAGNVFHALPTRTAPGPWMPSLPWWRSVHVPRFEVTVQVEMRVLELPGGIEALGERVEFHRAVVSVDGGRVADGRYGWGILAPHGCTVVPPLYISDRSATRSFGAEIEITADVEASTRCRDEDGRTSLRATVSTEELLRAPVTLTSPPEDALRVEVTIEARSR